MTRAGIINKNMTYFEFTLPIQISSPGKDSLDLDNDSKFDITFVKSIVPSITNFSTSATTLIKKAGTQIIISKLNNYTDSLNYGDLIDDSKNWSDYEENEYILQSENCSNGDYCTPIGNFINVTNKYIGFKIGKSFGWIKIDNSIWNDLIIKGFAISK
jgi:hypothetical protein